MRDFTLSVVAQTSSTSTTLASVTLDSATVTFAGTPITAAMDGLQIALSGIDQYFFLLRNSSSNITIRDGEGTSVNWPVATSTTATWRVFQTIYTLPTTADEVISLAGEFQLDEYDGGREALDLADPYRSTTDSDPRYWLYAGEDSSSTREIEIWPVPTAALILRGQFARRTPTLAASTEIGFNRALMVFATTADCLNMLHAKPGDGSYQVLGLFYERKAKEVEPDIKFSEQAKLSLPNTLQRGSDRHGADFWVNRQRMEN